jgi:tetratricopeptide (TPR) repeat protein
VKAVLPLLLLLFQEGVEERSIEVPRPAAVIERPAILLRTPEELPRAAPEAWKRFADPAQRAALLTELGPELGERLSAAERDYMQERYPTALEGLYAALEDQPDFPPALMLLGTTYFRLRRYQDCRIALERLLEVAPEEAWRTQALGHSYYSLGDYGRARSHYERVLAAQPAEVGASPEALRGLALCYMREGDSATALKLLDQVLELHPEHAEAHTFRARILYGDDRLEEALSAAERARELAPYDPQPWYFTMRILFDLGRDEEALQAEERWKELDRAAQEIRALESQLRFYPGSYPLVLRLCELAAAIGDIHTARARLADLLLARPADVSEVSLRILVLDVLENLNDREGARVAALALEQTCAGELAAWQRLERYYASARDRVNQVRCATQVARLTQED